jgi:hypothetical protein
VSGRQTLATLLAVGAALCAVLGASAWWVRDGVIDRGAFVHRAVAALDREPVATAISDEIAARAAAQVPAQVMSARAIGRLSDRAIRTSTFRRALRSGAGDVNDELFASGSGGGSTTLTVDLADVLGQVSPQLAAVVGAGGTGSTVNLVTIDRDSLPIDTGRGADLVRTLAVVLPALAFFALAAALAVAVDRARVLAAAGLATMVCGAVLLAGLFAGHAAVRSAATGGGGLSGSEARAAAGAIFDVYTSGLRTTAIVALVAGLAVGAGSLVVRGRRRATAAL